MRCIQLGGSGPTKRKNGGPERMSTTDMRTELIQSHLGQLRASLGEVRAPVPEDELRRLYKSQDYTGMVRLVRDSMWLDLRVRVGLVNTGGPEGAPAWYVGPEPMPRYDSVEFKNTLVTICLRRSFLAEHSFERIVMAIAHECSHIILNAKHHSLRKQEEVVDLTAMLLGYRDFYVAGSEYLELHRWDRVTVHTVGYLTPEEVRYAAIVLGKPLKTFEAPRVRRKASRGPIWEPKHRNSGGWWRGFLGM